jgi:hypothetical protein
MVLLRKCSTDKRFGVHSYGRSLMEPRSATPWDSGGEGPDIPLMFLIPRSRHDRDTVSRTCMRVQMHLGV